MLALMVEARGKPGDKLLEITDGIVPVIDRSFDQEKMCLRFRADRTA